MAKSQKTVAPQQTANADDKVQISAEIPSAVLAKLKDAAAKSERTLASQIRLVLRNWAENPTTP